MNRIRDHIRRAGVRPATAVFDETAHQVVTSPLEQAAQLEKLERYETALAKLGEDDREAIIGRVEFGNTYEELAAILGKPTADAARMAVTRALVRLAEEMKRGSAG
jgi:RNA polymerase sigma-70 factor (ECF subfamily)